VLDEVTRYVSDVVVIDDGSTDASKMILARRDDICFISHAHNRGYGQSIIDAFYFAQGCDYQWVITMDCDLQHEPVRLPDFLKAIEQDDADIISGSRYMNESSRANNPPADRRKINHEISELLASRLQLRLTDAFCGFKAFRVEAVSSLALTETGYAFPLEFWVQAVKHQLRVREIPVSLIYHDPNRHFGGELDDAAIRLEHYKQVLEQVMEAAGFGI